MVLGELTTITKTHIHSVFPILANDRRVVCEICIFPVATPSKCPSHALNESLCVSGVLPCAEVLGMQVYTMPYFFALLFFVYSFGSTGPPIYLWLSSRDNHKPKSDTAKCELSCPGLLFKSFLFPEWYLFPPSGLRRWPSWCPVPLLRPRLLGWVRHIHDGSITLWINDRHSSLSIIQ